MTVWWSPFGFFRGLPRSLVKRLPLRELSDLLVGGTIVETCIEKHPVLRTIIQLDGDVMTFVVPLDSPDESVYKKHWEKVENRLVTIAEQLNGVVRLVTWRIGLVTILIFVGHTLWENSPDTSKMGDWVFNVALSALPGLLIGALGHISLGHRLLGKIFLKTISFWVRLHTWASVNRTDLPPP